MPHEQVIVPLRVPLGATIEEAIRRSGILARFPEIDGSIHRVGIFGQLRDLDTVLHEGDRIVIYRPLGIEPKEARRLRQVRGS